MPRLNDQEIATIGQGRYLYDNTRTILQDCSSGACKIRLSDGTPISDRGNRIHLEARNQLWVSQDEVGVYGSFGDMSGAAIASGPSKAASELIGPDGSLIYKLRYQSEGPWFNTATGREIPGDGDSWQNLGGGKYIVRRGMEIRDETGKVLGRGWWPRARGDGHLLYQAETGELVFDGRIVAQPSPKYYRADYSYRSDKSLLLVWSPDESEEQVIRKELTAAELAAAPLYQEPEPLPVPTFHFSHPVLIAPFKDPEGQSGAPAEIVVNECAQSVNRPYIVAEDSLDGPFLGERLGVYTERADLAALQAQHPRLIVGHDDTSDWVLPALRPVDVPMLELYFPRTRGIETVAQSAARWMRQATTLRQQWPGDMALDPQFYRMGSAPPWLYTEAEVGEGLTYLSDIVNLSSRFKLILPFAFLRANGISESLYLRGALVELLKAGDAAGRATLLLLPVTPPPPPPPPSDLYTRAKEYTMPQTEIGAIKGPGNKFGRILQADMGKGPNGWFSVLFDRNSPDDDCWFELSKPDTRHALIHTKVPCIFGADATEHSDSIPKQFYGKPTSIPNFRGILESPVLIHDPASQLIVGYFTWPEKGVSGPAFTWVKRS